MRVAIASKDGISVNLHFGHAKIFWIYEYIDGKPQLVEQRSVNNYCHGQQASQSAMEKILATISDCQLMLSAKIGDGPKAKLAKIGVDSNSEYAYESIKDCLAEVYASV